MLNMFSGYLHRKTLTFSKKRISKKIFVCLNLLYMDIQKRSCCTIGKIPEKLLDVPNQTKPSFYDMVQYNFHKARILIEDKLIDELKPDRRVAQIKRELRKQKVQAIMTYLDTFDFIMEFNYPIRLDNGKCEMISAYKVQHKSNKFPTRGGLRYSLTVNHDELCGLAVLTSLQCAFIDIPHSGSTGGVVIDPRRYSMAELERITRQYTIEVASKGLLAPSTGAIDPDMGTDEQTMSWIANTYRKTFGVREKHSLSCVGGKQVFHGGIYGHRGSCGRGIFKALDLIINNEIYTKMMGVTKGWDNKTLIVQGFGNVGAHAMKRVTYAGCKCIGIQDVDCTIVNPAGFRYLELRNYKEAHNTLVGCASAQNYEGKNLIYEPCDILILAAGGNVISKADAEQIQAKIVVEGAHGPITPQADKVLLSRNILVLPDVYVNAGGITISYFEWLKNLTHYMSGKFKFKYTTDYNYLVLRSIQQSLTRQEFLGFPNIPTVLSPEFVKRLSGTPEKDIVLSGLDWTIDRGFRMIMETTKEFDLGHNFRAAANICAIRKLFNDVNELTFTY